MDSQFRTCPHCGTEGILLMTDGRCPHCKAYVEQVSRPGAENPQVNGEVVGSVDPSTDHSAGASRRIQTDAIRDTRSNCLATEHDDASEPSAVRLLETKFPGAPVEHFALCYARVEDRSSALKRFGQDVLAGGLLGLPGLVLFGGNSAYYADAVVVGLQGTRLILCNLGYVPVHGSNKSSISVTYSHVSPAIALGLKEPDKIGCRSAELADLKFSFSEDGGLSIAGTVSLLLRLIDCPDAKAINSAEEASLLFARVGEFPRPREFLRQLQAGRMGFAVEDLSKALSAGGYVSSLKNAFARLPRGDKAAVLARFEELPEQVQLFFIRWFAEYRKQAPVIVLIAIVLTILTGIFLNPRLLMTLGIPDGLFILIVACLGLPGIGFTALGWMVVVHHSWYGQWHKKLTARKSQVLRRQSLKDTSG
jgi:hypothetical protein